MTITNNETFFLESTQITTLLIVCYLVFILPTQRLILHKIMKFNIKFCEMNTCVNRMKRKTLLRGSTIFLEIISTSTLYIKKNIGERSCVRDLCLKIKNTVVFRLAFAFPTRNDKLCRIMQNRLDIGVNTRG